MEKLIITSLSNPLIKQARALQHKKARRESRLFLVEGIHHVGEAVEAGWNADSILYAPDLLTSKFARDLVAGLKSVAQPVSAHVMASLSGKENPQGIVAIMRQKQTQLDELKTIRTAAALVAPQDPGNVGTILRTLDAVGGEALFLVDGGVELYHPSVVRASMGTIFWKPVIESSFSQFVRWSRERQCQLIGTSASGDVEYHTFVPDIPWILVLGSEQKGLSTEQMNACDVTVSLPMRGRASSLNLAVAAGVLLYRFCNQT